MTDVLITALAEKLREAFSGRYEVYTEGVYMGAQKPGFFIECENAETIELLNDRYMIRITLAVTLEDNSDTRRKNAQEITKGIFSAMKYIEADKVKYRAMGLKATFDGKRVIVRGKYDMALCENFEEERCMMETVSVVTKGDI